jgi:NADH-quinone oxidoreductase subunit M
MLLLTTALTPLSFTLHLGLNIKCEGFLFVNPVYVFAMVGTFLAADGLLYYIFWELSLIPIYFIALIWGNGDAEERKSSGKILYLHLSRFLVYAYCIHILVSTSRKFLD